MGVRPGATDDGVSAARSPADDQAVVPMIGYDGHDSVYSGGKIPGRRYRPEDLEGHRWMFMQRPS